MGGYNSGGTGTRRSTANMHTLDIRKIQRAGLLRPGQFGSWQWTRGSNVVASINIRAETGRINLTYRTRNRGGEWQDIDYPVQLASTACNYGGERVWWLCPIVGCGRRVAVLFGGRVYACRHCHRLAYDSQRETPGDRATRRANALRKQLGWVPGMIHGDGDKPKGMHWSTYNRLRMAYYAQSGTAFAAMAEVMGLAMGRLGQISRLKV